MRTRYARSPRFTQQIISLDFENEPGRSCMLFKPDFKRWATMKPLPDLQVFLIY